MEKLSIVTFRFGKLLNIEAFMPEKETLPSTYSSAAFSTMRVSTAEFSTTCRTITMTAHIPKSAQSNGLNQRHAACLHFSFPMTYKYNQKSERAMK